MDILPTTETQQQQPPKLKLQGLNYANLLAYIANTAVTFSVGISGTFLPTNEELSEKYQTLVTPAGYAFSIWGVIFIAQGIWTVAQLLPVYRRSDLVIKGVSFYYVAACVAQIAWSITFALEWIAVSLGAMIAILIPLVLLVARFGTIKGESSQGLVRYWLLKFPFLIHCGWIWAASLVNSNVLLVFLNVRENIQTYAAWGSLAGLLLIAVMYACRQIYVIPLVLAWAAIAIYMELQAEPKESITENFTPESIKVVEYASLGVAIAAGVVTVISVIYRCATAPRKGRDETDAGTFTSNYHAAT